MAPKKVAPNKEDVAEEPATNLRRSSRSTRGSVKPVIDLTKPEPIELSDTEEVETTKINKKGTKGKKNKQDDQDIIELMESSNDDDDDVEVDDEKDEDFEADSKQTKQKRASRAKSTPAKASRATKQPAEAKTPKTEKTPKRGSKKADSAKAATKSESPPAEEEQEASDTLDIYYELNEKEMKEVNMAFDHNCTSPGAGDEKLTSTSLKTAIRSLGFEPRADEIQSLMKKFANRSGVINRDGFQRMMAFKIGSAPGRNDQDANDDISRVFNLIDLDKTGLITMENLRSISKELNEQITDEELLEMVQEADIDGDLKINKEEFYNIMKKTNLY